MSNHKMRFRITKKSINEFVASIKKAGVSANTVRRYKGELQTLLEYLGDNPIVTRAKLQEWRQHMESKGYSPATIQNYVKHINGYLRFVGCDELCFKRGRANDISYMTFGFRETIEPAGAKWPEITSGDAVADVGIILMYLPVVFC